MRLLWRKSYILGVTLHHACGTSLRRLLIIVVILLFLLSTVVTLHRLRLFLHTWILEFEDVSSRAGMVMSYTSGGRSADTIFAASNLLFKFQ